MKLILNIDTALDTASVCLAAEGRSLAMLRNGQQKEHAAWLHQAISALFAETGNRIGDLAAVAVSIGPGSYTGLRVGLSAAKGLCYARNLPLITVGTLELMAHAVRGETQGLICPLIDARRMDVFTAVFTAGLEIKLPPREMWLATDSFSEFLNGGTVLFTGNALSKLQSVISHPNARFSATKATAAHMAELSHAQFAANRIADLVYTEPRYLKEFYGSSPLFA